MAGKQMSIWSPSCLKEILLVNKKIRFIRVKYLLEFYNRAYPAE